jgi:uncharacterized SAM-binding protein YcdF (DUF218 family)
VIVIARRLDGAPIFRAGENGHVRRRVGVIGAVVVAIVLLAVVRTLVLPPVGTVPPRSDAVALLSGGSGDRLPRAVAMVRRGVADVLVIPNGTDPSWDAANALCAGHESFEVVCPTPQPDTTRGEAAALDQLARRRKWDGMVVVTSRYHLSRARVLLDRCVGVDVDVVGSTPRDGALSTLRHVAHEAIGLVDTVVVRRSC